MVVKIKDQLTDFALVEEGGVLRLKIWEQHLAEQKLGRPLHPDELPRLEAGEVTISRSPLPIPWESPEVRDVVGEAGEYFQVSEAGHLISKRSKKVVKQNPINQYPGHVTKIGGRQGKNVVLKAHQCVAEAFIENPDQLPVINHKDGNKLRPRRDNLEWSTHKENTEHATQLGLISNPVGTAHVSSKLSKSQVDEIRLRAGTTSLRKMAEEYGVSRTTIADVINYKSYR